MERAASQGKGNSCPSLLHPADLFDEEDKPPDQVSGEHALLTRQVSLAKHVHCGHRELHTFFARIVYTYMHM